MPKVLKIFEKYAESLSMFMGVYAMLFAIFFAAHLLSCFWYLIGKNSQTVPGVDAPIDGWVAGQVSTARLCHRMILSHIYIYIA